MSIRTKANEAFTLVELLVVITIIAILAGLAFPALSGAMNAAKRAQANAMVNQLRIAMTSYETEYNVWPTILATGGTVNSSDIILYNILVGNAAAAVAGQNPRRIIFMEFSEKDLNSTRDGFIDPWGYLYRIRVDDNYDGLITGLPGATATIRASVAAWSFGNPDADIFRDERSLIATWK